MIRRPTSAIGWHSEVPPSIYLKLLLQAAALGCSHGSAAVFEFRMFGTGLNFGNVGSRSHGRCLQHRIDKDPEHMTIT